MSFFFDYDYLTQTVYNNSIFYQSILVLKWLFIPTNIF